MIEVMLIGSVLLIPLSWMFMRWMLLRGVAHGIRDGFKQEKPHGPQGE